MENNVEIGDVLVCQWGYSMILYDFYRVMGKTAKSIKIQKMQKIYCSHDPAHMGVVPNMAESNCPVLTRRVSDSGYVKGDNSSSYMSLGSKYNGQVLYEDHMD